MAVPDRSVILGVARVDIGRVDAEQPGELLDHHVEHQFAELVLAIGAGEQRPPVQHDPGRSGRAGGITGVRPGQVKAGERDWITLVGWQARRWQVAGRHFLHGLEDEVIESLGPAAVQR
jgi:hypothetical protein